MKKKFLSAGLCLTAAIVWGFAFSFQEKASLSSDKIDAFFFGGIRFLVGSVSLIPLILLLERNKSLSVEEKKTNNKNTFIYGVITGAILFVAATLQQFGIQLTGESGKAGFITGMYLIFVPIVSFVIFKQKASPLVWIAVLFSFVGLYFLCLNGSSFTIKAGDILLFMCALCFTAHIIVIDKFIGKVSALKYSSIQFATVGVLNLIIGAFVGHITLDGIISTIVPILYCGIMSTGVAYTCQMVGQKFTPPAIAALLFSTEGLFSVIAESLIEKTIPSKAMIIGCSLMFIGIILSQIPFPVKSKKSIENQ